MLEILFACRFTGWAKVDYRVGPKSKPCYSYGVYNITYVRIDFVLFVFLNGCLSTRVRSNL